MYTKTWWMINMLTLSRIPLTIVFIYMAHMFLKHSTQSWGIGALIISVIIILTDNVDGKLARRFQYETTLGQKLDVYCDLIYIVCGLWVFASYQLISYSFIMLVILKFIEFVCLSKLIFKDQIYYDRFGRIVSGVYYILPSLAVILLLINKVHTTHYISYCITIIAILTICSSIYKWISINQIPANYKEQLK